MSPVSVANPYESGAAPSTEALERMHWTSAVSLACAVIAFAAFAFLIGYVIHSKGLPGFRPDPVLTPAGFIAWGLGSVLGSIVGALGLFRGRARRALALSAFL